MINFIIDGFKIWKYMNAEDVVEDGWGNQL
jgi:hypothetical protein